MRSQLIFFLLLAGLCHAQQRSQIPYVNSTEVLKKGIALYDNGEYKKAIAQFDQVHECDTNYTITVYEKMLALIADSAYERGKQLAIYGLSLAGADKREFMLALAGAYDYLDQADSAIALFDTLSKLYPNDHQPIYEQGVVFFRKKQYDKALSYFQRSAIINPYHFRTHYMLGRTYAIQGRLTEAMMALEMSLLVTKSGELAKLSIGFISEIVEGTDEMSKFYAHKNEQYSHPLFDDIDQIVNAKLALNQAYQLKISLNDNIFRQTQAIMAKLVYDPRDSNFAMQYYVPVLIDIYKNDQFEDYILLLFSDFGFEHIDNLAKKKSKGVENVRNVVFPYYNHIQATRILNYAKRKEAKERYHFFTSDEVIVVGDLSDGAKQSLFIGDVVIYRNTQSLLAKGHYNNKGEKDGEWTYYFTSGNVKSEETFRNNKAVGMRKEYYSNDNPKKMTRLDKEGSLLQEDEYDYRGWLSVTTKTLPGDQSEEVTYYSNGNKEIAVLYEGKKIKDGVYKYYYDNGNIKKEVAFKNGVLSGPYKRYNEEGKLSEEGAYDNNNQNGLLTEYFENGKVKSKCNYRNGNAHGAYEEYYDNGVLCKSGTYKAGLKDESNKQYSRTGKLFEDIAVRDGLPVSIKYTDATGKVYYEKSDANGLTSYSLYYDNAIKSVDMNINNKGVRNGQVKFYYGTGMLSEEDTYNNGNRDGQAKYYYKDGKLKAEANYANDALDGYYKAYYDNGQMLEEGWYKEGNKQGLWRFYYSNGKTKTEIYFLNDNYNGYYKNYGVNGSLSDKYIYDYGMLIGYVNYDSLGKKIDSIALPQGSGHLSVHCNNIKDAVEWECDLKYGMNYGPYQFKYYNGNIWEQGRYTNDKKDSIVTAYYPDGQIKNTGLYHRGNRHGKWLYYDEMGALIADENFREGAAEGKRNVYSGNMLRIAYNLHEDEKDGPQLYYGADNKIAFAIFYSEGSMTGYSYTGKDGQLLPEIPIADTTTSIKGYYPNGAVSAEINIRHGILNGSFRIYYSNGQIAEEKSYSGMDLQGPFRRYYPDGKLCYEVTYKDDEEIGTEKTYNKSGEPVISKDLYYGIQHGNTVITDPANHKTKIFTYHYGELIYADK